jgi:protease I
MKGAYFLFVNVIGIIVITVLIILVLQNWPILSGLNMSEETLSGKKIAMVIAFRDFRDEEYFLPKGILTNAGAEVKTVSNKLGQAIGTEGGDARVDYLIQDVDINDFDAVIFIGGPGSLGNLDNENSYNLVKETLAKNKVLGAICVSSVILARAGVLKGKKATVWSSTLDKSAIEILQQNGAVYKPESLVVDGRIVTANGPTASAKFGLALVGILK